jgi:hypothetical protein
MAAQTKLESRVAALEEEVCRLKALLEKKVDDKPWWEKIAGSFLNDPYYEKAMRYGRQYRESLRPKVKKSKRKRANGDS